MTDQNPVRPTYAVPEVGERVMVYDGSVLGRTVPAVYLGLEHVSDDFFMHRVRSAPGSRAVSLRTQCTGAESALTVNAGFHWTDGRQLETEGRRPL